MYMYMYMLMGCISNFRMCKSPPPNYSELDSLPYDKLDQLTRAELVASRDSQVSETGDRCEAARDWDRDRRSGSQRHLGSRSHTLILADSGSRPGNVTSVSYIN